VAPFPAEMVTAPPTPPAEDTPLAIWTVPLDPWLDMPDDITMEPLTPVVPEFCVRSRKSPEVSVGLPPVITSTIPPVSVPVPALRKMLPPTPPGDSVLSPARTEKIPPVPMLPEPTAIKMDPPLPPTDVPEPKTRLPELPAVPAPVLKLK
jgi:hypothetical protein